MLIAIIAIAVARSAAQDLSSGERFEVASIKPRTGERVGPIPWLPDRSRPVPVLTIERADLPTPD